MQPTINEILQERGTRYGEFLYHARIAQNIKEAMANSPNWHELPAFMREALEMIAHKIGRILNGDPHYDDSWIDIGGYSKLVVDELHNKEKHIGEGTGANSEAGSAGAIGAFRYDCGGGGYLSPPEAEATSACATAKGCCN